MPFHQYWKKKFYLTPEEFLLTNLGIFLEFLDDRFCWDHAKSFKKYRFRGEQFKVYL